MTSTQTAQGQLPLVVFIPLTGSLILEKLVFPIGVHMYRINCLLKSGGLSLLKTFKIVWKLYSKRILDIVNNIF